MSDTAVHRKEATDLRRAKNFEAAARHFRVLWTEERNELDGTGLLQCLRKLRRFEEALELAEKLLRLPPELEWTALEVIWTRIQGRLLRMEDRAPLGDVIREGEAIMALGAKDLAAKKVVFRVLKAAKAADKWDVVSSWVNKLDPKQLSTEPIRAESEGDWSDQSVWYNYRIRGLVETGLAEEAITEADAVMARFPRQRKFFQRLKALALVKLARHAEGCAIYDGLCASGRPDWWLQHERAKVLVEMGRLKEALTQMYSAAAGCGKLDMAVALFGDIGLLCKDLGQVEQAALHLRLAELIRADHQWSIPAACSSASEEIARQRADLQLPGTVKETLAACRGIWLSEARPPGSEGPRRDRRQSIDGLLGKVILGRPARPYCFIETRDGKSYFAFKEDLPGEVAEGTLVSFSAVPSFDRKKNRESWKAVGVKLAKGS